MVLIMAWFMATGAVSQDLEEQARIIGGKLMAPCCWAEPVSQHLSPVAEEMRGQIREMLAAGRSEQEILDFYVARYFILRRLRLRGNAAGPSPQKPVAGPNPYSERIEKELRDIDL